MGRMVRMRYGIFDNIVSAVSMNCSACLIAKS